MADYKLLIDGKLVDGAFDAEVVNPALGAAFATAPAASAAQMNAAIAAAKQAFPAWAERSAAERQACLAKLAARLEENAEYFSTLLTREQGKPLDQARFEVAVTIGGIRYCADFDLAQGLGGHSPGDFEFFRTPLGVVACITPWNFPMVLASNKYAPALLTGNTIVLKPAPTTPLTSLELGRLAQDVFPPGVFNVVADRNDLGALLTSHRDVAKISFTGSTSTGKRVMQSAAEGVKRVTLELGGNDPAIVLDDADVDAAASNLAFTAFINAGQVCVAPKRIFVAESVYDAFCERFAANAKAMKLGGGEEEGVAIGPIQNLAQFEKVRGFLEDANRDGVVIAGGHVANRPGYFIEPTVVRDIDDASRLVEEEQFGPIVPILSFASEDEAIARANNSIYGLGASVWSRDVARAKAIARRLEAGTVWINQHLALGPHIPFAGAKQSGLGVECGVEGVWEFTRIQVINAA